jgi:hypothetical protein
MVILKDETDLLITEAGVLDIAQPERDLSVERNPARGRYVERSENVQ